MNSHKFWRSRHWLAAMLTIGGLLRFSLPVWADGTAAGTSIKNTATGTFSDGTLTNGSPTIYNTTSNEVTIEVSEVAGINVTAQPPSNASPNAGETLYVEFVITNTGNDPTQFFIPGTATLSNSTAFQQNGAIQIVAKDGTALTTFVNVPANGDTTATLLSSPTIAANPGTGTLGTITVRVPIQALPSATASSTTTVSLGNTTPVNGQNIDVPSPVTDTKKLYTVDNANGVGGETNTTTPSTKEAMATSGNITVGARLQSFATVLKAIASYNPNGTINNLADDVLTYNLALRVENPAPPPAGFVAADLHGTRVSVNGNTTIPYVLISDAIPAGFEPRASNPTTASPGWVAVYTQSLVSVNPLDAVWVTTPPTSGGPITRVGFVYDSTTAPLSRGSVGIGNTISGFSIALTPTAGYAGGQVANIAQVFGQSQPGTVVPGTATQIVYDESGDQTYNNGLIGNNPDPNNGGTPSNNGGITNGVADVAADGTDPGNGSNPTDGTTNQGVDVGTGAGSKGFGGEATVYTIAATPLNGPSGQPAAVGPTDNNDDFTNKSLQINLPPNTLLSDAQTPAFTFNNTVQNTSGGTQLISILPVPPATTTALPDNTRVIISDGPSNTNTATYNYTQAGGWAFVSGTGTAGGAPISATNPVALSIAPGGSQNYQTIVDLPGSTAQFEIRQFQAFPIPIVAFVDVNDDGSPAGEPGNQTIDRLYTNYVRLIKKARILEANGTPVTGAAGSFTDDQSILGPAATPGRLIEYEIAYSNISSSGGTNNVILPANNLVITENGTAGTNNWGSLTIDPLYPTPATGSANDPGGSITVSVVGGDIAEYQDTVASVAPGASGRFTFQRKIK